MLKSILQMLKGVLILTSNILKTSVSWYQMLKRFLTLTSNILKTSVSWVFYKCFLCVLIPINLIKFFLKYYKKYMGFKNILKRILSIYKNFGLKGILTQVYRLETSSAFDPRKSLEHLKNSISYLRNSFFLGVSTLGFLGYVKLLFYIYKSKGFRKIIYTS